MPYEAYTFSFFYYFRPLNEDRYMVPDIEAIKGLLQENKIWKAVKHHIDYFDETQAYSL